MKKNKMELIVGGTIFIALFILIAGVLWLKGALVTNKMVQYTVLFPDVGTLQQGDPVLVNGVKKGLVSTISLRGVRVAVTINLDREVTLTDVSRITVQNIGIMGERMVGIRLSAETGKPIKPNGKNKNEVTYIEGYFDTGIAEAMGLIGTVLADVQVLVKNVARIVDGTVGDTAFSGQLKRIVSRLEIVVNMTEGLLADNRPSIDRSIAALEKITVDVAGLIDTNKQRINNLVADGSALGSKAVSIAGTIDSLSLILGQIVTRINNGEGTVGLVLKDDKFYYDLKKAIVDLDTFITVANNRKNIRLHITNLWPWSK